MYQILSKTSSFLERSITFSVDGKVETIAAPASVATFDDLILRIEQEYGGKGKGAKEDAPEQEPTISVEAEKPKPTTSKTTRKKTTTQK